MPLSAVLRPAGARRKRPRPRAEVEAERRRLQEETDALVDELVKEFHALLPRDRAQVIGAIYARYSTRFQFSVVDQVRGCLEEAVRKGIFVPRENICYDLGIRGAKSRRPGLDRLRSLIGPNAARVILLLSTNRLFRKTYKAMQFVEEEVVGRGLRCVFVRSNVDTADEKR